MKLLIILMLSLSVCTLNKQLTKKQVIENINNWYLENPEQYSIEIKGKGSTANITRYHTERPEEKDDLIEITYKGMIIQLIFTKPLDEISTNIDSLQKYFNYISLNNIYNKIPSAGWDIYPRTPLSSLSGKGVNFTSGGESLSLTIDWSIYSVMGYKDSEKCKDELSTLDGSVSEECQVFVDKKIPLKLVITEVPLK
ncbi:MAG: hypothetical protein GY756_20445 [bacterium]|nr:hypothetical protein [bacterium]